MLFRLILLFTLIPILELALLFRVASYIGGGKTFLIIILTGILGATMAKLQGLGIIRRIQQEIMRGTLPAAELFNGLLIVSAGLLLLTPGLITDGAGLFLLIPSGRRILKCWLRRKIREMVERGTFHIRFFRRF